MWDGIKEKEGEGGRGGEGRKEDERGTPDPVSPNYMAVSFILSFIVNKATDVNKQTMLTNTNWFDQFYYNRSDRTGPSPPQDDSPTKKTEI